MQEEGRGERRLLIKARDKETGLRQIYDKHLGNPAPKIGSTPVVLFKFYTIYLK